MTTKKPALNAAQKGHLTRQKREYQKSLDDLRKDFYARTVGVAAQVSEYEKTLTSRLKNLEELANKEVLKNIANKAQDVAWAHFDVRLHTEVRRHLEQVVFKQPWFKEAFSPAPKSPEPKTKRFWFW